MCVMKVMWPKYISFLLTSAKTRDFRKNTNSCNVAVDSKHLNKILSK